MRSSALTPSTPCRARPASSASTPCMSPSLMATSCACGCSFPRRTTRKSLALAGNTCPTKPSSAPRRWPHWPTGACRRNWPSSRAGGSFSISQGGTTEDLEDDRHIIRHAPTRDRPDSDVGRRCRCLRPLVGGSCPSSATGRHARPRARRRVSGRLLRTISRTGDLLRRAREETRPPVGQLADRARRVARARGSLARRRESDRSGDD